MLIVSQVGTVVAFLAVGFAGAAWVLFASRIFDGLTGGNVVVAQAYITDITPDSKRAQALGLIGAMFGLGFIMATFALFGQAVLFETNVELGVGIILAILGLSQIVTQVAVLPRFLDIFGEAGLITVAIMIRAIGLAVFAVMVDPWQAALGAVFFAAGGGLTMPPIQSLATKTGDDSIRGGILGLVSASQSLSIIVSTAIGGLLFTFGPYVPNYVSLGVAVASLGPAIAISRVFRRQVVSEY